MLHLQDQSTRLCDGLSRREWLRVGGLTAFGLSLPALLEGRAASATPVGSFGKAKACILLFHLGGPPQHETWDLKPDAPAEIRGPFKPIATNVPGIQISELMPRTAGHLDKICVLRSMSTNDNAHSASGYWMLTGVPHQPLNVEGGKLGAPNDWPSAAALARRLCPDRGGLPSSVVVPEHIWNTGMIPWPGQDGGFLGRTADPWLIHCHPDSPEFQVPGLSLPAEVPGDRMGCRVSLLQHVNQGLDAVDRSGRMGDYGGRVHQAFDLLRAGKARQAFDLDREPAALRDRYGRNRWGQSVLLARRLIEAGVSLVQVNWTRMPPDDAGSPAWDNHANNARRCKELLCPKMDLAYSALLEDLALRGLLDQTIVVWMGEFGRSPKINSAGGRDHWGHVFSAALAGGGVRGGQVIGSSDKIGGFVREGRVMPQDLLATVFHCLGHPPHTEIHDALGRPIPMTRGEVLRTAV